MKKRLAKITPQKVLLIFILINLLIGLLIVEDYGQSSDESIEYNTAQAALEVYSQGTQRNPYQWIGRKAYYGTGQTMLFNLAGEIFAPILNIDGSIVRHFGYFITFQISIFALFLLAGRFINSWNALIISVLYGTQPVLFGHAFINPKDIPLLMIFMVVIVTGFRMADHFIEKEEDLSTSFVLELRKAGSLDWKNFRAKNRIWWGVLNGIGLGLVLFSNQIKLFLGQIVTWAYTSPENTMIGKLFTAIAQNKASVPLESYIGKTQDLFRWYIVIYIGLTVFQLVFLIFPIFSQSFIKGLYQFGWNHQILFASIAWGICMATRVLGIVAGGMVGLYFLIRAKRKAIVPLVIYSFLSILVLYAAWPFLWFGGFTGLIRSLTILSDFPWEGQILFAGKILSAPLPKSFIPTLMALKFTPPLIVLGIIGAVISVIRWRKSEIEKTQLVIVYLWLLLPLAFIVLFSPNVYSLRQFFFITPPLFIFAGITLNEISARLRPGWLYSVFILIILLPGLFALVHLHPYQYIYFNGFVGGVDGAFRQYELDYWLTSTKEAAEYINENLPGGIKVGGPKTGLPFIRSDITYYVPADGLDYSTLPDVDYVILPSKLNHDLRSFTDAQEIFGVYIDDIRLAVVKKVR